ncbi:MAG: thioredoxin domain-containing protein [Pyrodictiaceae archaeon]
MNRFRLDFRRYSRLRYAGIIVVITVIIASASIGAMLDALKPVLEAYSMPSSATIHSISVFNKVVFEISEKMPVAIMFRSTTCPDCQAMYPYWRVLERTYNNSSSLRFYDVVLDQNTMEIFDKYDVTDLPTFVVFYKGGEIARYVGLFKSDNITNAMLEWVKKSLKMENLSVASSSLAQSRGQSDHYPQELAATGLTLASISSLVLLGLLSSLSPCVLPLLLAGVGIAAMIKASKYSCGLCLVLIIMGVLSIGVLFSLAGSLVMEFSSLVVLVSGAALLSIGFSSILGVSMDVSPAFVSRTSLPVFCFLYGLLVVQCNLPLVIAALLVMMSPSSLLDGLLRAISFAIGVAVPVALALFSRERVSPVISRALARHMLLSRIGGIVLLAIGLIFVIYSLYPSLIIMP